jgi:Ca-activated chloride channel family protein
MRFGRRWFIAATWVLGLLAAGTAGADGLIVIHDPPPLPHPMPYPHHRFAPLEVRTHRVQVRIDGQVAVTEVDQVFVNPTSRRLEGTYLFPVPGGAQLDRFSMDVNGKLLDAELLDADKARRIYEDIVRTMRDPALMEYAGRDLLRARIFPIEPHGEKRVTLRYTQLPRRDGALVEYL